MTNDVSLEGDSRKRSWKMMDNRQQYRIVFLELLFFMLSSSNLSARTKCCLNDMDAEETINCHQWTHPS